MRTRINGLLVFTVLSVAGCGNNVNPVTLVIANSISGPFAAELTAFTQEASSSSGVHQFDSGTSRPRFLDASTSIVASEDHNSPMPSNT